MNLFLYCEPFFCYIWFIYKALLHKSKFAQLSTSPLEGEGETEIEKALAFFRRTPVAVAKGWLFEFLQDAKTKKSKARVRGIFELNIYHITPHPPKLRLGRLLTPGHPALRPSDALRAPNLAPADFPSRGEVFKK